MAQAVKALVTEKVKRRRFGCDIFTGSLCCEELAFVTDAELGGGGLEGISG